jgi:hypothetical protein
VKHLVLAVSDHEPVAEDKRLLALAEWMGVPTKTPHGLAWLLGMRWLEAILRHVLLRKKPSRKQYGLTD